MTHQTASFQLHKGSRKTLEITVTDESGDILDITGTRIEWHLAQSRYSTSALIMKGSSSSTEINIVSSTAGRCNVHIRRDDTTDIRSGVYYHELLVVDSGGQPFTSLEGYVTLEHSKVVSST